MRWFLVSGWRWAIVALLIFAFLWVVPNIQVPQKEGLGDEKRLALVNEYRRTWAQILGGAALLSGVYFTWRTLQVNREGQITERFTRAIDQLGATNDDDDRTPKLEVRLGGIYALERIARDSKKDHWPVMEVLTAYLRANAPWDKKNPSPSSQVTPSDVQAILNVLKNRRRHYQSRYYAKRNYSSDIVDEPEEHRLHLAQTNLRQAYLRKARLEGASLRGANLEYALLRDACLEEAWLQGACLRWARFGEHTKLDKTVFNDDADPALDDLRALFIAEGESAEEELVDLITNEEFGPADLTKADLRGVDLSKTVGLTQNQIALAIGDSKTTLPSRLIKNRPRHWEEPARQEQIHKIQEIQKERQAKSENPEQRSPSDLLAIVDEIRTGLANVKKCLKAALRLERL